MSGIQKFAAVLFAVIIANPLCCCFAHAAPTSDGPAKSCCESSGAGLPVVPAEAPCGHCQTKNPRTAEAKPALLVVPELPVVAVLPVAEWMPPLRSRLADTAGSGLHEWLRPPRFRTLLFRQFLI